MQNNLRFIAWSKSTRANYLRHRARFNEYANTLNTGDGGCNQSTANFVGYTNENGVFENRKLTPIECERLQGYEDNHTQFGRRESGEIYEISNTQRYQQCGNGIASNVSAHIVETLLPEGNYKVFSLFSGIGGTELKLSKRFEVVAHCEWDKFASDVLRYHHPNIPNFGDVTKVMNNPDQVPYHDILFFGHPCQSFSEAGLRQGLESDKGKIIYDIFKIIEHFKPKYIVEENVKGLLTHEDGNTFTEICRAFSSMGYEIDFNLFNASNFGLPQIRNRMFLFGRRKDG